LDRTRRRVPVQLSATVVFDDGAEIGIACFFRELSEIRKMEQAFADQARLSY